MKQMVLSVLCLGFFIGLLRADPLLGGAGISGYGQFTDQYLTQGSPIAVSWAALSLATSAHPPTPPPVRRAADLPVPVALTTMNVVMDLSKTFDLSYQISGGPGVAFIMPAGSTSVWIAWKVFGTGVYQSFVIGTGRRMPLRREEIAPGMKNQICVVAVALDAQEQPTGRTNEVCI